MSYYELLDLDSGRLIATPDSEAEALTMVRQLLTTGFPGYVDDLGLGFTDEHAKKHIVAEGPALAARALAGTAITPAA